MLIPVGGTLAAESTSDIIEEIVVTATFRETRLMDTPQAITALGEQTLIEKGVLNLQSLYQDVPGMNYSLKSNSYSNISIRGLTPPAGGGAVVGVYLDDIPITDSNDGGGSQSLQAIYDVQRVEVLKGPQGTLYGEGNMGGAPALHHQQTRPGRSSMRASGYSPARSGRAMDMRISSTAWSMCRSLRMYSRCACPDSIGMTLDSSTRARPATERTSTTRRRKRCAPRLAWYVTPELSLDATVNYYNSEYGGPSISDVPYGNTQSTSLIYEQQFGNGGQTRGDDLQSVVELGVALGAFAGLELVLRSRHPL